MSINVLQLADELRTEADAYLYLERMRWGDRPVCPHCGSVRGHYFLKPANGKARKTRTERRQNVACGSVPTVANSSRH